MKSGTAPSSLSAALDLAVRRAHWISSNRLKTHPYFLATDIAACASLALGFFFTKQFPQLPFVAFVGEFFAMTALYKAFLLLKERLLGIRSRSYLQDTVIFLLPAFSLLNLILGYPFANAFDLVGVMFPLYVAIVRIGCFFGGCCYGLPSSQGVLYPHAIFSKTHAGCRSYQPGPDPGVRVFPVQLVESFGNVLLFGAIAFWAFNQAEPSGLALLFYLLGYSVLRFVLDFFRRTSARPRIGYFSEAQVFCVAVALASLALLIWQIRA